MLTPARRNNDGIRRCWRHACLEESIIPTTPPRLPLLFALDATLASAAVLSMPLIAPHCATLRHLDGAVHGGAGCIGQRPHQRGDE